MGPLTIGEAVASACGLILSLLFFAYARRQHAMHSRAGLLVLGGVLWSAAGLWSSLSRLVTLPPVPCLADLLAVVGGSALAIAWLALWRARWPHLAPLRHLSRIANVILGPLLLAAPAHLVWPPYTPWLTALGSFRAALIGVLLIAAAAVIWRATRSRAVTVDRPSWIFLCAAVGTVIATVHFVLLDQALDPASPALDAARFLKHYTAVLFLAAAFCFFARFRYQARFAIWAVRVSVLPPLAVLAAAAHRAVAGGPQWSATAITVAAALTLTVAHRRIDPLLQRFVEQGIFHFPSFGRIADSLWDRLRLPVRRRGPRPSSHTAPIVTARY